MTFKKTDKGPIRRASTQDVPLSFSSDNIEKTEKIEKAPRIVLIKEEKFEKSPLGSHEPSPRSRKEQFMEAICN